MALQKKNNGVTMLVIGLIVGLIGGAFLPDSLSPLVLFKKKTA